MKYITIPDQITVDLKKGSVHNQFGDVIGYIEEYNIRPMVQPKPPGENNVGFNILNLALHINEQPDKVQETDRFEDLEI